MVWDGRTLQSEKPTVRCAGCHASIQDKYLLNVLERTWHARCVTCHDCGTILSEKCYSRESKLYCRNDFIRRFGTKCGGCSQILSPNDMVRKAKNKVFHVHCFTCAVCQRQLATGEELYVMGENKFVCKNDYVAKYHGGSDCEDNDGDPETGPFLRIDKTEEELSEKDALSEEGDRDDADERDEREMELSESRSALSTKSPETPEIKQEPNNNSSSANKNTGNDVGKDSGSEHSGENEVDEAKKEIGKDGSVGAKRRGPRTTIKAKQLEVLKAAFAATPKPTRHIREELARETGLNMRVIQVWFQNRRSKERRMKQMSALGARRGGFFRNPRPRMRGLRPGEIDDGGDMLGFGYFADGPDFYPGYPGYDYFAGQDGGPPFLPPTSSAQPISADMTLQGSIESQYLGSNPDMLAGNSSPEPHLTQHPPPHPGAHPGAHPVGHPVGHHEFRQMTGSGFGMHQPHGPDMASQEAW